jgi:hypothetical protein
MSKHTGRDHRTPPQFATPLLDLSNTILINASILTHYNLSQHLGGLTNNSAPASSEGPPPQEVIDATGNLLRAASDIARVASGPSNYLKSFSYAVCFHSNLVSHYSSNFSITRSRQLLSYLNLRSTMQFQLMEVLISKTLQRRLESFRAVSNAFYASSSSKESSTKRVPIKSPTRTFRFILQRILYLQHSCVTAHMRHFLQLLGW